MGAVESAIVNKNSGATGHGRWLSISNVLKTKFQFCLIVFSKRFFHFFNDQYQQPILEQQMFQYQKFLVTWFE